MYTHYMKKPKYTYTLIYINILAPPPPPNFPVCVLIIIVVHLLLILSTLQESFQSNRMGTISFNSTILNLNWNILTIFEIHVKLIKKRILYTL